MTGKPCQIRLSGLCRKVFLPGRFVFLPISSCFHPQVRGFTHGDKPEPPKIPGVPAYRIYARILAVVITWRELQLCAYGWPSLSRLAVPLRRYLSSCRPRRRRKGRGSRVAGETAGCPRGASPARSEATQREGAARPLRIGVNKRVARYSPLAGAVICSTGEHKREARHTPLAGSLITYRQVRA